MGFQWDGLYEGHKLGHWVGVVAWGHGPPHWAGHAFLVTGAAPSGVRGCTGTCPVLSRCLWCGDMCYDMEVSMVVWGHVPCHQVSMVIWRHVP